MSANVPAGATVAPGVGIDTGTRVFPDTTAVVGARVAPRMGGGAPGAAVAVAGGEKATD